MWYTKKRVPQIPGNVPHVYHIPFQRIQQQGCCTPRIFWKHLAQNSKYQRVGTLNRLRSLWQDRGRGLRLIFDGNAGTFVVLFCGTSTKSVPKIMCQFRTNKC